MIFVELSRSSSGSAITFQEMKAYSDLTGYELSKREMEVIQTFNITAINKRTDIYNKNREK